MLQEALAKLIDFRILFSLSFLFVTGHDTKRQKISTFKRSILKYLLQFARSFQTNRKAISPQVCNAISGKSD